MEKINKAKAKQRAFIEPLMKQGISIYKSAIQFWMEESKELMKILYEEGYNVNIMIEGYPTKVDEIKVYLHVCSKLQGNSAEKPYCVAVIKITFSEDAEELIIDAVQGFTECIKNKTYCVPFPRDEETGKPLRHHLINVIPCLYMTSASTWPPNIFYEEKEMAANVYPIQITCKEWPLKPFVYSDTFKKSNVFDAIWGHQFSHHLRTNIGKIDNIHIACVSKEDDEKK